jgi:hypothetical protein
MPFSQPYLLIPSLNPDASLEAIEHILSEQQIKLIMRVDGDTSLTDVATLLDRPVAEIVTEIKYLLIQGVVHLYRRNVTTRDLQRVFWPAEAGEFPISEEPDQFKPEQTGTIPEVYTISSVELFSVESLSAETAVSELEIPIEDDHEMPSENTANTDWAGTQDMMAFEQRFSTMVVASEHVSHSSDDETLTITETDDELFDDSAWEKTTPGISIEDLLVASKMEAWPEMEQAGLSNLTEQAISELSPTHDVYAGDINSNLTQTTLSPILCIDNEGVGIRLEAREQTEINQSLGSESGCEAVLLLETQDGDDIGGTEQGQTDPQLQAIMDDESTDKKSSE